MTARLVAFAIILAFAAAALLLPARPKPLLIEATPAAMPAWILADPPNLCPAPLYFCRGSNCRKPRSIA